MIVSEEGPEGEPAVRAFSSQLLDMKVCSSGFSLCQRLTIRHWQVAFFKGDVVRRINEDGPPRCRSKKQANLPMGVGSIVQPEAQVESGTTAANLTLAAIAPPSRL